jgi:AAA family ATP:ADP antiporter
MDPRYYDPAAAHKEANIKGHVSLKENFLYLFKSRYLTYMALVVFSYNVVINLVEVLWKHEVRKLYPNPSDYSVYMNEISSIIGFVATISAMVVSANAIKKFGWTFTALLTPVILLVTSIFFFGFIFLDRGMFSFDYIFMGASPLAFVVFFGTLQNILSRGAKYTVFDATKEMAYVPLSPEVKLNGKASIDGVCSRMGKSGGAFVHQSLLLFFGTLSESAPFVGIVLFAVIGIWIMATKALGREFTALTEPSKAEVFVKEAASVA